MPEEKADVQDTQAAAASSDKTPKVGGSMTKVLVIVVVAIAIQSVVFVLWFRSGGGESDVQEQTRSDVERGSFVIDKIYFHMPLYDVNPTGGSAVGQERQVAVTVVVNYDLSKKEQAEKLLASEQYWIRQETREVIRNWDERLKVLKEDPETMKAVREALFLRIQKRLDEQESNLLVGPEVIFSSFNISG